MQNCAMVAVFGIIFVVEIEQKQAIWCLKRKSLNQGPSTDGARTLLNLLCLLGTEHRWCEDPIESALFIRVRAPMVRGPYYICVVYYY